MASMAPVFPFWRGTESPAVMQSRRPSESRESQQSMSMRCHGSGENQYVSHSRAASGPSVWAAPSGSTRIRGSCDASNSRTMRSAASTMSSV